MYARFHYSHTASLMAAVTKFVAKFIATGAVTLFDCCLAMMQALVVNR